MAAKAVTSKSYKIDAKLDKETSSYSKAYTSSLVIGIIIFLITIFIAHKHHFSGINLSLFRDLNNLSNSFKTPALIITEGLGAAYPIIVCVLAAGIFKRYRLAWRFFVACGSAGVLMEIGKHIAKEPRPIVMLSGHLHARAVETGLTSFPSGHEAIATALALTLWLILPNAWRWLSVLWIAIVFVSRVYLGVHTPLDVIGGFSIGLICISAIELLPKKWGKKAPS